MMNRNMLIVVRFGRRRFAAHVTRVRPQAAVHPHVIFQIIRPMERLPAHGTRERLLVLVLLDVPLTVVLTDKFGAAIIARVRPDALVRVHVRHEIRLTDERPLALIALEGLVGTRLVRPPVQLQVPLGRELALAYRARKRAVPAVAFYVRVQG